MDEPAESVDVQGLAEQVRYIAVSPASRISVLQRLLDELDPPSATILVRSAESREMAQQAIRQLGYRDAGDPVQVAQDEVIEGTHLIVFFDAPVSAAAIAAAAEVKPAQMITLLTPRELAAVRELIGPIGPYTLASSATAARQRDRALRGELETVLATGIASRDVVALEPLLDRYDGVEIAAAALRLLEREREKAALAAHAPATHHERPHRDSGDRPERSRDDRGNANRGPRDFAARPKREFTDRPPRDFGNRPPRRDTGDRPPKRDFGAKREFGKPRPSFGAKREFGSKRGFGPNRDAGSRPRRDFDDRRGGFKPGGRPPRDR
jgi:hypothetical protein